MLLSEVFNEKYEFENVFVKESDNIGFKVVDNEENIIFDKMGSAEAFLWGSKVGASVHCDLKRYYQEQLDFLNKPMGKSN